MSSFLHQLQDSYPNKPIIQEIVNDYEQKLWSSVMNRIDILLRNSNSKDIKPPVLFQLYESCLKSIETKLNKLKLSLVLARISDRQPLTIPKIDNFSQEQNKMEIEPEKPQKPTKTTSVETPFDVTKFVDMEQNAIHLCDLCSKRILSQKQLEIEDENALIVLETQKTFILHRISVVLENEINQRIKEGKTVDKNFEREFRNLQNHVQFTFESIQTKLETLNSKYATINDTFSFFFGKKAELLKNYAKWSEFYGTALLYLAYSELMQQTEKLGANEEAEKQEILEIAKNLAYDMSIAALVAEKIYTFGELIQNPIIFTLKGTEHEWLVDLLNAYNTGNISAYKQIENKHAQKMNNIELLKQNKNFLEQKMQLMALLELIFIKDQENTEKNGNGNSEKNGKKQRILNFKEISEFCVVPVDSVEIFLLKALGLGLVIGTIDEVEHLIRIQWSVPRVLDKDQIRKVSNKVSAWITKVDEVISLLESTETSQSL